MYGRPASRAIASASRILRAPAASKVPDCMVTFGHTFKFSFMSNPAVMAVSSLLDMPGVVQMRATFTPEHIEAMKVS